VPLQSDEEIYNKTSFQENQKNKEAENIIKPVP
jgi:hypothetical protein